MTAAAALPAGALFLGDGEGRAYDLGAMSALFKVDDESYTVSEWWLEPHSPGPGAHSHETNDELFHVLEGTAHVLVGDTWVEAGRGAFLRIPAGVTHDFENRTAERAGLLNVFVPGGFEKMMPAIVEWFRKEGQG